MKFKSGDLVTWDGLRGANPELCIVKRGTYQAYEEKYSRYEVYVCSKGKTRIATSLNLSPVNKEATK
tara:strand:- start:328 stop:528 length:201 start_codon:yes stop_codon:yes gene_type:complete